MEDFFNGTMGRIICAAVAVAVLILITAVKKERKAPAKQLVFCGMLVALGTATSFVGYSFPFGGSITLMSMLFICLAGFWYGPAVGIMTGFAYGLIQFAIKPQFYYPAQFLLDYLLGFSALGLSGFFRNMKHSYIVGSIAAMSSRFIFSVLSGYFFFAEYAWEGWSPMAYSIVYNAGYIYPELLITICAMSIPAVKAALDRVKKMAI